MKTVSSRFFLLFFAAVVISLAGVSCNTVRGFGRDVERTGDHISDAAR